MLGCATADSRCRYCRTRERGGRYLGGLWGWGGMFGGWGSRVVGMRGVVLGFSACGMLGAYELFGLELLCCDNLLGGCGRRRLK